MQKDIKKYSVIKTKKCKTFFKNKKMQNIINQYDVFLSVEFSNIANLSLSLTSRYQPLIFWIQDPRPQSDWDELDSMSIIKQNGCRPNSYMPKILNRLYKQKRLIAITQGKCLVDKAIDLYKLPEKLDAQFVPNPVVIPQISDEDIKVKKNNIVFLGRLDSVKRPWIIAEVAKQLPEYNFCFLGQYHEEETKKIMQPYYDLKNCFFLGHIEGSEKDKLLRESKILINSSIHEAVPISFLEALSYGMLLVSNRNPDNLTSEFGFYTGQVNGDGYDSIELFQKGIQLIMENETMRIDKAQQAIQYIKKHHNIARFKEDLRQTIYKANDMI